MRSLRRFVTPALCAALALSAVACAGTPGPGEPGYPFNVTGQYQGQFVVDGQAVGATLSLETRPGGEVSGEVRVAEMGITARMTGMLAADRLTVRIPYHNPQSGCDGVVEGTVTVGDGGSSLDGPLSLTECGQGLSASMRFRRS